MKSEHKSVTLWLVEDGAPCDVVETQILAAADDLWEPPHVLRIVQEKHEKPAVWAARVRRMLADFERQGTTVDQAVIAGGARFSHEILAARTSAVRALAALMVRQGRGELVLDGGVMRGPNRWAMTALAHTMRDEWGYGPVSISERVVQAMPLEKVA